MEIPAVRQKAHYQVVPPSLSGLSKALALTFVLLSLLAVTAVHIPWFPLGVQAAGHSFTNLIGQEHRWNMFSADPRGTSLDLWATIEHVDGSEEAWTIDKTVAGGDFRFYRWVKWTETAVLLEPPEPLRGFAEWVGVSAKKPVQEVTVYGLQHAPAAPGSLRPEAEVSVLFRWNVAEASND